MELRDLKIGDYVRTKYGIKQIYEIDDKKTKYKYLYKLKKQDDDCINLCALSIEDIIKASDKLIDLVEVEDYVNGRKVYQVGYNFQDCYVLKMSKSNYEDFIYPNDIKSIVTKESFEQISYKVGD